MLIATDLYTCLNCGSTITLIDSGDFMKDMDNHDSFIDSKVCCDYPEIMVIGVNPFRKLDMRMVNHVVD